LGQRMDRRKVRTRKMLHDALISLITERDFDSLTIEDITNRADLRRATFYLHYRTKDELLLTVLQTTFDQLVEQMQPLIMSDVLAGKTQIETYAVMFRHVGEHSHLYSTILSSQGGAAIARNIRAYLAGHIEKAVRRLPQTPSVPPHVLANYMAGAELGLITWWLESGQPYSPETMAEMTRQLLMRGVVETIGVNIDIS
jgi:AcrR family transcriptional regulator